MGRRHAALLEIVRAQKPMTVRQVYYQATVRGLVDKTDAGYNKIQRDLVRLRREGRLPFSWITDSTRLCIRPETYGSLEEAIASTARHYRRDLWRHADSYVEFWIEKDALSGVVSPVTEQYDVPLMIARGFSSITFLETSARYLNGLDKPSYIYHLGDHDPSGVAAGLKIEEELRSMAPDAEIHFESVAVTPLQIELWKLPSRETKRTDSRAKNFVGDSVELDAIPPDHLRALVRECIERHVDHRQLDILKVAERSERAFLREWALQVGGKA